jgi:hypothetical protein
LIKVSNQKSITYALGIVRKLDFNLIIGYMLYNPETTFDELKKSVDYLVSEGAPLVQELHGMNILRGTREEKSARNRGILIEKEFYFNYIIQDRKVSLFVDVLRHYYPLYRSVVLDMYELLFLLVNLPNDIKEDKKQIDTKLFNLHKRFLQRVIFEIDEDILDEYNLLDSLKADYEILSLEAKQLVISGRNYIRNKNTK